MKMSPQGVKLQHWKATERERSKRKVWYQSMVSMWRVEARKDTESHSLDDGRGSGLKVAWVPFRIPGGDVNKLCNHQQVIISLLPLIPPFLHWMRLMGRMSAANKGLRMRQTLETEVGKGD